MYRASHLKIVTTKDLVRDSSEWNHGKALGAMRTAALIGMTLRLPG